ncbi:hypothetical protein [Nocardia sp. CA-119907]|uniref:hypothetical protein n=1 Tax=Nocardia sp. CA-119907 TaxID=3239973 RepID=UPI003D97EDB3
MKVPRTISRHAALEAGLAAHELSGPGWQRICRGRYARAVDVGGLSAEQRHLLLIGAVAAGASSAAVVSHVSAAVAHGLPIWSLPLTRVHMTRNRASGARIGPRIVVHATSTEPDEVVQVGDFRVTTMARTVIDLARTVPFEQAVVIGDAALRFERTTRSELAQQLSRSAGRPGCPAARRVVEFLDGRAESPGESRSRAALRAFGFPAPELQPTIVDAEGAFVARVDFLFPTLGVVGEFDGMVKYRSNTPSGTPESAVIAEKIREDALRALGWIVIRWIWRDLDTTDRWRTRLTRAADLARPYPRSGTWHPTARI